MAERLRHVCAHLSEDEFGALVSTIAEVKIRWWRHGLLTTGKHATL